jgi:autoinducer 2-degrading protein
LENFALIVEFEVRPEHLQRFNELVAINARASVEKEPGCQQFDVLYQADEPNRVVLYEIYDSAAAFAEHMACEHTKTFLQAAKELVVKQTGRRLLRSLAPTKAA